MLRASGGAEGSIKRNSVNLPVAIQRRRLDGPLHPKQNLPEGAREEEDRALVEKPGADRTETEGTERAAGLQKNYHSILGLFHAHSGHVNRFGRWTVLHQHQLVLFQTRGVLVHTDPVPSGVGKNRGNRAVLHSSGGYSEHVQSRREENRRRQTQPQRPHNILPVADGHPSRTCEGGEEDERALQFASVAVLHGGFCVPRHLRAGGGLSALGRAVYRYRGVVYGVDDDSVQSNYADCCCLAFLRGFCK